MNYNVMTKTLLSCLIFLAGGCMSVAQAQEDQGGEKNVKDDVAQIYHLNSAAPKYGDYEVAFPAKIVDGDITVSRIRNTLQVKIPGVPARTCIRLINALSKRAKAVWILGGTEQKPVSVGRFSIGAAPPSAQALSNSCSGGSVSSTGSTPKKHLLVFLL